MDEIHWKPEDHTRAATEGILRATQNNGSELKNVALAVENLKDDINHPDDVIEVLEESRELLEEIASKETPKQMAVTLEGVSVVQIKGDKGDKHTDEELLDLIKPLIPDPIKGEKGDEPSDDRIISLIEPLIPDPVKGDPGEKPSEEELKRIIKPLIPPAAKPIKPSADELTEIIKPLIPKPKNGKDGSPDSPDEVVEKVNKSSKKIESNQIIGLPDLIKNFENNSGKGGAGRTPLIIQGAGTKLSDHVTAINFSTNLTAVYSGNGIVTITGSAGSSTPAGSDTEVQFNDGGAFGSDPHFTYDKVNDVLHTHKLAGDATDGLIIESANGTDVGILGAGNTANVTWYGNHNYDAATANTIASFGASKTLSSLSTATYPSLTELSYVKGLTSALQAQLDAKAADSTVVHDTGDETIAGIKTFSSDPLIPDEAYDATAWNGSLEVPTKNAIRDKIEAMLGSSGITRTVTVSSGSFTAGSSAATDYIYFIAGAHTASLPAAAGNTNRYTFKNNHSANITIDTVGVETIEGVASISIAPEESVDIMSDGTNYFVV